ncbi:MAG: response regulator [Candidatus Thiodiazotropha sp. (ex Epidulcina cf. delphinae)]|nr:response regulator [Candidatus Thiodiazotropha sp. (ex Epidulcina cf. delphinae)]
MNILIAEDSQIIQVIHRELMRHWGYGFDIASNGKEAVDFAQSNDDKYDLCLMDIEMPTMNGIEATKIIRKTVKYFPIMALTSNGDYEKECYEAGMDGFAIKPCPHEDLLARIKRLTVKIYKLIMKPGGFNVTEVMPVDKQHAQELQNLKKQGLIKMRLDGPDEREVIAHKNTPNKISHDFNVMKQSMTEFLNRDPDRPTVCDLYRGSKNCIIETFIDEGDYNERLRVENEKMETHLTKHYGLDEE